MGGRAIDKGVGYAKGVGEKALSSVSDPIFDKLNKTVDPVLEKVNKAVTEVLKSPSDRFNDGLNKVSDRMGQGKRIIQDDAVDMFAEQLPDAAGRFIKELKGLTTAIVDRGREIGKWNGTLAQANAQSDVRKMLADYNEAKVAGGSYARVTDQWSKFEYTLKTSLAPLKDGIASAVADLLKLVNTITDMSPGIKLIPVLLGDLIALTAKIATFDITGAIDILNKLPQKLADALKKKDTNFSFTEMVERTKQLLEQGKRDAEAAGRQDFDRGAFRFPLARG